MSNEIHVNDIGTRFIVTILDNGVVVDISTALSSIINFRKPDNSIVSKDGNFLTDGIDGKIYCTSESGDLDLVGNYKIQGKVTLPTGVYYTSLGSFKVHCNL